MTRWTQEVTDRLSRLHESGQTYGDIGRRLSIEFGGEFTRGMVSGQVFRMGLTRPRQYRAPSNKIEWTAEMDEFLRESITGLTGSQISHGLLGRFGVSVHPRSVLSRARRLGLSALRPRRPSRRRLPAATPVVVVADEDIPGVPLLELPPFGCGCRWPLRGEGADMLFCGVVVTGTTYCQQHGARATREG